MPQPENPAAPDQAQLSFHKCCGRCPEGRKAAAEGTEPAPHTPCAKPAASRAVDEPVKPLQPR
ncbi:MAG: hypothetical protein KKA05_05025 [Alphaproteobacteria bacterium]|nr:hypothetical protein [Alphaproteobacteria bacterium]MBU0858410.1 hypothetical protein [Alphaproteobacteria bacterium]